MNQIEKNQQMLAKEQQLLGKKHKNMMKQMSIMKTKMSSKLFGILDMLTNLQGDRTVRVHDQARPMEAEKEVVVDDEVDAMEVYH